MILASTFTIACPDNVNFNTLGNLWTSTDGAQRGQVSQFLVVVGGAVCASFELSSDDCQLVVSMLRSGEGSGPLPGDTTGAYLSDLEHSAWPGGGLFDRSTMIQV